MVCGGDGGDGGDAGVDWRNEGSQAGCGQDKGGAVLAASCLAVAEDSA